MPCAALLAAHFAEAMGATGSPSLDARIKCPGRLIIAVNSEAMEIAR